jgi:homoserine dehydrogenase
MRVALAGFGSVGRALARLLLDTGVSIRVAGILTARHGAALDPDPRSPSFGPPLSFDAFLDASRPDVLVELTPLDPTSGEPAISHIRAAFARRVHVVTANKGPLAFAYHSLAEEARQSGCRFLFESTVMDGCPVFNLARHCLPGVRILGFTALLNSTTTVVLEAMEQGRSFEDGVAEARRLGIAEANPSYDTDGWDAAVKTAALANVFWDARVTPLDIDRRGIGRLSPGRLRELIASGKTIRLVARGSRAGKLRVRAEVLSQADPLASVHGTSNLLLLHTDLMGTIGTVELAPTPAQTAYGVLADLMEIAAGRDQSAAPRWT